MNQEDIEWIDAAGDYMCVQAKGTTYIMRKTMKELEKELDGKILQRIHRSTIVNITQVREMESHINGEYFLTLESGHRVKLSRTYKDKLKLFRIKHTPRLIRLYPRLKPFIADHDYGHNHSSGSLSIMQP